MSAYVALQGSGSGHGDDELLHDRASAPVGRRSSERTEESSSLPGADVRLRAGFLNSVRSLATSTMVIGVTILAFACVAVPIPKLSPLPSILTVAVFATLMMLTVAVVVLIRDDRVEDWAPNLLFVVLCAVFFTIAAAFVAIVFCNQEKLSLSWKAQSPERRRHLMQELNDQRLSSALNEDEAGLVIVAENAMTSLHIGVLSLILFGIEIAIVFPMFLVQHVADHSGGRGSAGLDSITRSLQEAGLI